MRSSNIKKFFDFIKLPNYIRFTLITYFIGILFFSSFRFILFLLNLDEAPLIDIDSWLILFFKSFFMGLRFDTVISGYILAFPFFVYFIFSLFKVKNVWANRIPFFIIGLLYSVAFVVCSANIPFFNHYFENITTAAFLWADSTDFVFDMIIQEWTYWIYFILFLVLTSGFWFVFNKVFKTHLGSVKFLRKQSWGLISGNIGYFLLFAVLLFLGIRGRIDEKSPIRTGTAYFSQYPFPNKLGLNPVFTLLNSYILDKKSQNGFLGNIDGKSAVTEIKRNIGFIEESDYGSPIVRKIIPRGEINKLNVVVIIMESMSAEHLKRNGETKNLTPFLDKLIDSSYYFENYYTSGIHTYNGIFSTLFGLPTLFKNHPMNLPAIPYIGGFAVSLKPYGYKSLYFTTHDDQFDNAGGFIYGNEFDSVIAKSDYPAEKILSTLGVPDHFMFEYSIPIINQSYLTNGNFFAAFLTSSNHGPYKIPDDVPFRPINSEITDGIVEYSDWALKHFMEMAKKQEWYDNTVFVFTADHGTNKNPFYDLPLCFTHSPLIIFSPKFISKAEVFSKPASQIDIFATIMGILNVPYYNNSLGVDLLNENRKFVYFCSDDKIGCLNDKYYLILGDNAEYLFDYKSKSLKNYINEKKSLVDSMRSYVSNMLVGTDYLIKSNLIKLKK